MFLDQISSQKHCKCYSLSYYFFSSLKNLLPSLNSCQFPNSLMLIFHDVFPTLSLNQTWNINALLERRKVAKDLPESYSLVKH